MYKKVFFITLIVLLGFLSIGALFGGGALIISPDGELLKMPVSMLESSPFGNFFIPGLILFSVLGIAPGILIYALIKKPQCKLCEILNFFKDMHWAWSYCIYIAFATIIWILVQIYFIQAVVLAHIFYVIYGLLIIFIALLPSVRAAFMKEKVS
ncbi:MAG: hypothetical protein PHR81_04795 [Bacteroidales bacterium]|jgi:hypothetical protein|nr:hypothetical protein [Bacteroidales bacterium]MDD4214109.1 hypothetical protein [Bacteroidales bacterium]